MGADLEPLLTTDWRDVLSAIVILAIAFVVALPIAWDRERVNRTAGLRTFPLVSTASAGFVMVTARRTSFEV